MADDIVDRLRVAETTPLDADTKVALFLVLQDARAEITRLRAEINRLREERRWIPVEERLPERYEGVIVAMTPDRRGVVEVCEAVRYYYGGKCDFETAYGVYECSHWQPLPAPPSEGEVEG